MVVIENEEEVEVTPAGAVLEDVPSVLTTGIVVVGLVVGDTSGPIVVDDGTVDAVLVGGVVVDGVVVDAVVGVELLGLLPGAKVLLGEPPGPGPPAGEPAVVVGAMLPGLVVVEKPSPGLETPPAPELGGPPAAEVPPGAPGDVPLSELVAGLVVGVVVAPVSGGVEVELGPPNWVPPGPSLGLMPPSGTGPRAVGAALTR